MEDNGSDSAEHSSAAGGDEGMDGKHVYCEKDFSPALIWKSTRLPTQI